MSEFSREAWLVHIAHDVGSIGEKKTNKIIEKLSNPIHRTFVRSLFEDVIKYLESTSDYDEEIDVDKLGDD